MCMEYEYYPTMFVQKFTSTSGPWKNQNQEEVKTDSTPISPPWSHPKSCPHHCWTDSSLCRTSDLDTVHRTTLPLIGWSPEWAGSVWGHGFALHMSHCDPRDVLLPSMTFSINIWGSCTQSSCDPPSGWRRTLATCSSAQHGPGDIRKLFQQDIIVPLPLKGPWK